MVDPSRVINVKAFNAVFFKSNAFKSSVTVDNDNLIKQMLHKNEVWACVRISREHARHNLLNLLDEYSMSLNEVTILAEEPFTSFDEVDKIAMSLQIKDTEKLLKKNRI